MMFMKEVTLFCLERYQGCYENFYAAIGKTSFCNAIANIYDKIGLSVFKYAQIFAISL